jgi:membrane associated rhomboid family serine protease
VIVEGAGFGDRLVRAVCTLGMVPGELTGMAPLGFALPIAPGLECAVDDQPINWLTPFLSMFLHGGWEHLLGNALFLWVFGNNIEDVMGAPRFALFYVLCGLAAGAAHVLADPASPVPAVGASGAISGVMGAYFVLFPRVRVRMLFIFVIFFRVIPLPAWLVHCGGCHLLPNWPVGIPGGKWWAHVGFSLTAPILFVRHPPTTGAPCCCGPLQAARRGGKQSVRAASLSRPESAVSPVPPNRAGFLPGRSAAPLPHRANSCAFSPEG